MTTLRKVETDDEARTAAELMRGLIPDRATHLAHLAGIYDHRERAAALRAFHRAEWWADHQVAALRVPAIAAEFQELATDRWEDVRPDLTLDDCPEAGR